jgi:hypothetical protein
LQLAGTRAGVLLGGDRLFFLLAAWASAGAAPAPSKAAANSIMSSFFHGDAHPTIVRF